MLRMRESHVAMSFLRPKGGSSVNPTASFPRPNREPARTLAGKWPVVAQLPNVADDTPSRSQSPKSLANIDAHDYRFDPPQARSLYHPHDGDHPSRASRRQSPILPSSDPFAIGGASTLEKLGPIVRFVLLVALFTAAGIIMLAGGNNHEPAVREKASTESTVTRQSLEPVGTVVEASASAPTAAGPTSMPDKSGDEIAAHDPDAAELKNEIDEPAPEAVHARDDAAEAARHPYPETAWPAAVMPEAGQSALPHVQTNDPPQAVAHLPGIITEIPQRHASHDDNQPGLH
jgi:hypothetical protein